MVRITAHATGGTMALAFYTSGNFSGYGRAAYNAVGGAYYSGDEYLVPAGQTYMLSCAQCWGAALDYWHELR